MLQSFKSKLSGSPPPGASAWRMMSTSPKGLCMLRDTIQAACTRVRCRGLLHKCAPNLCILGEGAGLACVGAFFRQVVTTINIDTPGNISTLRERRRARRMRCAHTPVPARACNPAGGLRAHACSRCPLARTSGSVRRAPPWGLAWHWSRPRAPRREVASGSQGDAHDRRRCADGGCSDDRLLPAREFRRCARGPLFCLGLGPRVCHGFLVSRKVQPQPGRLSG